MARANAGIYCRISRDTAGLGLGIERQEKECRALCAERGWTVTDVYVDNDISASRNRRRPSYERLLADVQSGRINAVVAWHNDRLHRSTKELEGFIDAIEASKARVAVVQGGEYDLTTATGRMQARIVGAVARHESELKGERHRAHHAQLATSGRPNGGQRPFGYAEDRVTILEPEAEFIRQGVNDVMAGKSVRSICFDWNEAGILTARGHAWNPNTVRRVLMSPRNAGLRRAGEAVVAEAVWPAIIDRETFKRVHALLSDPSRRVNGNPSKYLLTGLALCGLCGHKLVARPRDDKRRCYVCAKGQPFTGCGKIRVLSEPLEDLVVAEMFGAIDEERIPETPEATDVFAEVERWQSRLDELARDFYAERVITKSQFISASQALQGRLTLAKRAAAAYAAVEARNRTVANLANLRDAWEEASFGEKRAAMEALVERVEVGPAVRGRNYFDPDRVHIAWRE